LDSENIFTAELRKILTYKEELLTDVKNMLYHRTDDVERLQKVIVDTEQQFAGSLQQIKTLGKEKEQLSVFYRLPTEGYAQGRKFR
jgi:hypothetical protein